jgi:hypothetical protein
LIRILAPQKEKDTATLKVENDIWNYLPQVKRVIKLRSTTMSASWMGSHFTNDDLVKESRMAEDYNRSLFRSLADPVAILAAADSAGVPAVARAYGEGLLAHDVKAAGAVFWGVDPARERRRSTSRGTSRRDAFSTTRGFTTWVALSGSRSVGPQTTVTSG